MTADSEKDKDPVSIYRQNIHNELPNGLTLLQVGYSGRALMVADLRKDSRYFGWLFRRHADGQWVTSRKLSSTETEEAYDQAADFNVLIVDDLPKDRADHDR